MANYLQKTRSDMLMSWLATASPDEWHQLANSWNWGSGDDALRWIAEQPNCDKATALLIFWRGSPEYYWKNASSREELIAANQSGLDKYDMLVGINTRWKAGGFKKNDISYDPGSDWGASASDVARSASHPALAISSDMTQSLKGRKIERGDYDEGIPFHIVLATVRRP